MTGKRTRVCVIHVHTSVSDVSVFLIPHAFYMSRPFSLFFDRSNSIWKPEVKRPSGRPRYRWKEIVQLDQKEIRCQGTCCVNVGRDQVQWRALVDTVFTLRFRNRRASFRRAVVLNDCCNRRRTEMCCCWTSRRTVRSVCASGFSSLWMPTVAVL